MLLLAIPMWLLFELGLLLEKILIKNERNNDLVSGNETLESS
jgi:sec-independent protein translocase protein TatC